MLQRNSSFVTTVWRVLPRQLELEQPVLLAEAQARLGFLQAAADLAEASLNFVPLQNHRAFPSNRKTCAAQCILLGN